MGLLLPSSFLSADLWKYNILLSLPDVDVEVSGHTKDYNGTYCSSACAGHNELEQGQCLSHKKMQLIPYTIDLKTKVVG